MIEKWGLNERGDEEGRGYKEQLNEKGGVGGRGE